jgi:hypothetical protein
MTRLTKIGLLALAVFLLWLPRAYALVMQLSDGATTVTISDNGPFDSNAVLGAVTYVGAVGSYWWLNVTTGTSAPVTGTPVLPELDLSSVNISTGSAPIPPLTALFTDTGFGPLPADSPFQASIGGVLAPGATLDYVTWLDPMNVPFAQATKLTDQTFGPGGAFSGTINSGAVSPLTPYSLTEVVTLRHPGGAGVNSSFNATLAPVPTPEPATLLLLGSGFVGLGAMGWRRNRRN